MANHAIDVIARDPYAHQNAILRAALIAIKDRALLAEGMPTELVRADMREIASAAVYALTKVTKESEGGAA